MATKHLSLDKTGYSDYEAAWQLFRSTLIRQWWIGFVFGILFMAILDFGDMHICVGECDGAGYDIMGTNKIERK